MLMKGFCMAPDDISTDRKVHKMNIESVSENIITDPTKVLVILMQQNGKRQTLRVAYGVNGTYYFSDSNRDSDIQEYVYITIKESHIFAKCCRPAYFKDDQENVKYSIEVIEKNVYKLEKFGEKYYLYFEYENAQSIIFQNYYVPMHTEVTIGRLSFCDLIYRNKSVKDGVMSLFWEKGEWIVSGDYSNEYVSINSGKGKKRNCIVGDVIDYLSLKIILGPGFIAINDKNGKIVVNSTKLKKHMESFVNPYIKETHELEEKLFNRYPRRREALVIKPIVMEAPPISLSMDGIPLLLRMGSPLVMSSASLLMGNITAMLSSVLFPVLTQKYTDKQRKDYEERRTKKYNEYLTQKKAEINEEIVREEEILNKNYPEFSEILTYVDTEKKLWERRKNDDDFLSLRLGYGNMPMLAECDYPRRSFNVDEDPLIEQMYHLVENKRFIKNIPIMSSFVEDNVCGVLGNREMELDFVKRILMQLVLLHSYDEVKVIFLADSRDLGEFSFVKYIPHIWTNQKDFRFLATNTKEASQISEFIQREVGEVLEKPSDLHDILKLRPYYFVFALDKRIFDSMEILKDIMQTEHNCGVSVLTVFDDLPKECVKIFDLRDNGQHSVIYLKQIEKNDDHFSFDPYELGSSVIAMNKISNIQLKILTQSYALPKMISFLEMFGVGKIEQLNPLKRWKENNPVKSLATPVGVDTEGELFYLDLHEKYQGPHGLVAGMTGSGKSEFIITYILSMAVNYHPDEVAFILIDYKGGGLAGAFEDKDRGIHLPHLVGTITNLDGSAIQRSLMSIQSELKRRQHIFNKAKSLSNEGTMDIYTYQKLYRSGQVYEALPHLFIISDEFAELKAQEPDFMDQLISAARIGRSLGVHLILATQKPAGVVNDQIWSNTKFRVCLKVQDRGDSIEMLKRPEAAELRNTGRFYLQVGYNEFFALGQSAWCGAPYIPQEEVIVQQDDEIQFVDSVGQSILKVRPNNKINYSGLKQIVAVVKYLSELAKSEDIQPKSLWQEPLGTSIDIEEIIKKYKVAKEERVEIPIGVVDDPYRQLQYPYVLDIQSGGNVLVVGTSGSGKTTFIQTVLYMLTRNYSSDCVNYYIFDFSSRTLSFFKNQPHCGCVLMDENEGEVEQVITYLETIIEERKNLFAQAEVSSYDAYIKSSIIPLTILFVDNLTGLDELKKGRDLLERITNIMRNGASYGIKIIASISNLNDCLYRMQHEFGTMIALQANDKYAYSNILNVRCQYQPVQVAGRGMCAIEGEGLELQIGLFGGSIEEENRMIELKRAIAQFAILNKGSIEVNRVEIAKTDESYEEFCDSFADNRLPLGYNMENGKKVAIPFQQLYNISIYFGNKNGINIPFKNLLYAAKKNHMEIYVVKRLNNSIFDSSSSLAELDNGILCYECNSDTLSHLNDTLISIIKKRTEIRKRICTTLEIGTSLEEWSELEAIKKWRKPLREETIPILVIFESMLDLELNLGPELVGKYQTIFNLSVGYNIYFIAGFYPDDQQRLRKVKKVNAQAEIGLERSIEQLGEESSEEAKVREIRHAVSEIEKCFNKEKFCLLFGGKFDCQNLVDLPYEFKTISSVCKPSEYNRFLLNYRGNVVRMQMPMEKEERIEDFDEMSII